MTEVSPEFLMDVFNLESPPQLLKSESTGLPIEVNTSKLCPYDNYIVQGPGRDIFHKRSKVENRNSGKYFQSFTD